MFVPALDACLTPRRLVISTVIVHFETVAINSAVSSGFGVERAPPSDRFRRVSTPVLVDHVVVTRNRLIGGEFDQQVVDDQVDELEERYRTSAEE